MSRHRNPAQRRSVWWSRVDTAIGVARYRLRPPGTLLDDLASALPAADELAPSILPEALGDE